MNRNRRGVAMLGVLVALLLLSILGTGFFIQARDSATLSDLSMAQTIALNNAEMGMQEAVRRIRAAQIAPVTVMTCTSADVDANACVGTFTVGPVSGPAGANLLNGGGLLYTFLVYRRPATADPGLPPNRYVVRVTGFFGPDINSESLVTSILEAEVDMGTGFRTACVGGYECT